MEIKVPDNYKKVTFEEAKVLYEQGKGIVLRSNTYAEYFNKNFNNFSKVSFDRLMEADFYAEK
jgi:hypothetical protein